MELDNASKCRKNKNKSIHLVFSKDSNNQNWLVSNKGGKNTLPRVRKRAPKSKPSLKICLPIKHYSKAMQQYNNANAETKTPSPNQTEVQPSPQEMGPQPNTPLPMSPSTLRMFRHPVPTSKGRVMLTDKIELIIKPPEPISTKATLKYVPSMPHCNVDTPVIKDLLKKKTEVSNTPEIKPNTTTSYETNIDLPISMKHKLPLIVLAPKGTYGISPSNPVNKENRLNTSNNVQTTVVQATQTEKVFIVHEEDFGILETIKKSGLTYEELQKHIDNLEKGKEGNNTDSLVIDLESTEESNDNDSKDNNADKEILTSVMKHSISNKNVLNSAVQIMQMLSTQNRQPSAPANSAPPDVTPSTSDQQPLPQKTVPPATPEPPKLIPYADMVHSFMVLATLQKFGYRLTNSALETPQIHVPITPQRPDLQTAQAGTQTGDENNNSKRRRRYASVDESSSELVNHLQQNNYIRSSGVVGRPAQELSGLMPQQQELSMFQPQTHQSPQTQIQQFVPKHVEQSTSNLFPSNLPNLMQQHRNQFMMSRSQHQYPFDNNRNSAVNTPQIQVQMPSPVQPLQYNGPRQRSMQRPPRLSRVLSTQEANMHSQAAQHTECNWPFPQYCDRPGNPFSLRHH